MMFMISSGSFKYDRDSRSILSSFCFISSISIFMGIATDSLIFCLMPDSRALFR